MSMMNRKNTCHIFQADRLPCDFLTVASNTKAPGKPLKKYLLYQEWHWIHFCQAMVIIQDENGGKLNVKT